jgi:hypothetical protein
LENATVNVDVPRRPGFLDEETLLLQNLVSTDGREQSLGSAMGISYSNSGRAIPVRDPLTALSRTEMPVLFGSLGLSPRFEYDSHMKFFQLAIIWSRQRLFC